MHWKPLDGAAQSQVKDRIGLGFPELLRAVLRQAPDVIMIGEIRDPATAAPAVHAANSGHLVLATLHAPLAAGAVQSMHAWGVNCHFLAGCLLGVIAQRLLRTLCPACRAPFPLDAAHHSFADVERWLGPGEGLSVYAARGCPACYGTGYAGRAGAFELLRMSAALRQMIAHGQTSRSIQEQAAREGCMELRQAALLKVARGETTAEEVVRAVPRSTWASKGERPPPGRKDRTGGAGMLAPAPGGLTSHGRRPFPHVSDSQS